ncbi:MAG: DUF2752 domain-containing protein [Pedobacter sp.]|nr:MAG: DUF2752 domain-containing protein [Pedobacter sp.]
MKLKLFLILSVFLTESNGFIHWLEHNLLTCPFKANTGLDCPGCGIQRSILALMQGDVVTSFKLYPATMPILGLLIFTLVHLKFDLKNGAFIIKMLYIAIALIIVINYIYKIFTNQLV